MSAITKASTIIVLLSIMFLILSNGVQYIHAKRQNGKNSAENFIQLCCHWGEQLADGLLTYKINGGESYIKQAVRMAAEQWDSKITDVNLQEVKGSEPADINIAFKNDGKSLPGQRTKHGMMTAGLTSFDLRGHGLIDEVHIILAKGVRGHDFSSSQLQLVAEHEIGHALGLGHSNSKSSIMYPTISKQQSATISSCEINAIHTLNAWKFFNGDPKSHSSGSSILVC